MKHVRLGVYQIDVSYREWIIDTGILPGYGKMMKKVIEKEDMLDDTQGVEEKR